MSFRDRMSTQNAVQLLSIGTTLGLITAASTNGKKYNFPLMLFGLVSHETTSSNVLLHQFLLLLLGSVVLDLWHLLFELSGLPLLLSLILLILKGPIGLTCVEILRQRGETLNLPGMGGGFGAGFAGLGQGQGQGGYQRAEQGEGQGGANWNMPGGFGAGNGPAPAAQPPAQFPSSGGFRLGGEEDSPATGGGVGGGGAPPQTGRGGYQTID